MLIEPVSMPAFEVHFQHAYQPPNASPETKLYPHHQTLTQPYSHSQDNSPSFSLPSENQFLIFQNMEQTPPIGDSPMAQPNVQSTPNPPPTEQAVADAALQFVVEGGVHVVKSASDIVSTGAEVVGATAQVASAAAEVLAPAVEVAGHVADATITITGKVVGAVLEGL
jgi:hypothetical protein